MRIAWPQAQKPPIGTPLDRDHPLVGPAALRGFYALNEAGGSTVVDYTGQVPLSLNPSATLASWSGGAMPGLKCVTKGAGASAALPKYLQLGWPLTMACAFRYLGAPGTDTRLFYLTYDNDSVTSPYCSLGIHVAYNGDPYQIYNSGGTSVANMIGSALTAGNDYVFVTSISKASQLSGVYSGGSVVATLSETGALSNPTYGTTPQVCLGEPNGSTGDSAATPNYLVYWAAWWASFFPASLIATIGASPNLIWQVFASPRQAAVLQTPPAQASSPTVWAPPQDSWTDPSASWSLPQQSWSPPQLTRNA